MSVDNKEEKNKTTKKTKKKNTQSSGKLTEKQKKFCREYIKDGNGRRSAIKAGYSERSADNTASTILKYPQVRDEIARLSEKKEQKAIMDSQELMELYSAIARGEVKDQFGLDANLADRIKAMNEIAKRTIDIENRVKGVPDNSVSITIDWGR